MNNNKRVVPQITRSVFTQQVNDGWTREALRNHYGLSAAQLNKVAAQLNVNIQRSVPARFNIIDDVIETINNVGEQENLTNINN